MSLDSLLASLKREVSEVQAGSSKACAASPLPDPPEAAVKPMPDSQGTAVPPASGASPKFDGDTALPPEDAEALAWNEDDRRRCTHCLNLAADGICRVAEPGGRVKARRGYQPHPSWWHRCPEYLPGTEDPDSRPGRERWPEFRA
jgi:hypothetical protein